MRSPKDMKIIMIDITNACSHLCSNCTRFCGNHKKPYFMDFEIFKKAVDSLVDAPPIIGIIGGEPTLHPDFDRMMRYYRDAIPEKKRFSPLTIPVKDSKILQHRIRYMRGKKRGLFSSFGPGYRKNYELIQDTFSYQSVNDHSVVNNHQAILATRKELGFNDEEWLKLRDNCWIQNLWSATVTPKGAFFCEIAAHLDMLFNGPGGWPIEPGWWKRTPNDFKEQLNWCEFCSVALPMPTIPANDQRDIVTPAMLEKLKAVGSPRVEAGRYILLDPATYRREDYGHARTPTWYIADQNDRISSENTSVKVSDFMVNPASEKLRSLDFSGWVVLAKNPADITDDFRKELQETVLNPGVLYTWKGRLTIFHRSAEALRGLTELPDDWTSLWDKAKRYELRHYPHIGTPDLWDKVRLFAQEYWNRLAPLRPW